MQQMQEMIVQSLGGKDPLVEGMATHSSVLAWSIPWAEESGGLQSTELQWVGHDWSYLARTQHALTPNSQSTLPSPVAQVCSLWVFLLRVGKFICVMLYILCTSDIIWYLSFWLTSLSMIISSCIHIAARLFFLTLHVKFTYPNYKEK